MKEKILHKMKGEEFPSFNEYLGDDRVICVTLSEVEKHCLDKKRVREELIHLKMAIVRHEVKKTPLELIKTFEKELGL